MRSSIRNVSRSRRRERYGNKLFWRRERREWRIGSEEKDDDDGIFEGLICDSELSSSFSSSSSPCSSSSSSPSSSLFWSIEFPFCVFWCCCCNCWSILLLCLRKEIIWSWVSFVKGERDEKEGMNGFEYNEEEEEENGGREEEEDNDDDKEEEDDDDE